MGEAKSQNIIKLTQLLVSLSLCSFLFSPSSLLTFLHYFNFYFSSFPFQLFAHTIDKNCMFLLCNGLLVFVGITRSFSGSSPSDLDDEPSKHSIENGSESQFSEVEAKEKESEVRISEVAVEVEQEDIEMAIVEDEEQEEEGKESGQLGLKEEEEEEADEETGTLEAGDDGEEEKRSGNDEFLTEENVDEEEENWRLTTEEMNKKFDDFIRRMKEDLRIEAQRQLVMV